MSIEFKKDIEKLSDRELANIFFDVVKLMEHLDSCDMEDHLIKMQKELIAEIESVNPAMAGELASQYL